ncbi:MAG: LysE family transporter [Burkholderiales bacterium]|nr:LysE family transporter [Burkholderiales bacterium]
MTLETWLAFLVAAFLISFSPGPGAISCMAAGLRFGLPRALWNLVGLVLGIMFVLVVVATGLGALLATSAGAFTLVKWLGVAYLAYLGIVTWRVPAHAVDPAADAASLHGSPRKLVAHGFLVNATNPKGIVFMLAVLPQFIDLARPQAIQYVICAATLVSTDLIAMTGYTAFAAKALRLMRKPSQMKLMNRALGGVLMAMSALLATFKRAA